MALLLQLRAANADIILVCSSGGIVVYAYTLNLDSAEQGLQSNECCALQKLMLGQY